MPRASGLFRATNETMKRFAPFIVLPVLALAQPAWSQMTSPQASFQSLRVVDTDLPVFPHDLLQLGVREGQVRVAFSVDTTGKVDDCLAVAYTHPEFARVTVNSLRRWKFEPAKFRGQPIASASEVVLKFEVEGTVVVSLTPSEAINARLYALVDGHDTYRPRLLNELDRIPTPITTPSPSFPARLAAEGSSGTVTVSFYIDETGAVRLPSVDTKDDADLASAAIDALRLWKFEPPTCKDKPVLVRASQQFNFRSLKKAAATATSG